MPILVFNLKIFTLVVCIHSTIYGCASIFRLLNVGKMQELVIEDGDVLAPAKSSDAPFEVGCSFNYLVFWQ